MYDLIIAHGTIIQGDRMFKGSVCIKDGIIEALLSDGCNLPAARETIDVSGKLVFPGMIDVHAHLGGRGDGGTESESVTCASKAAAVGGFTTCIDMPTNSPVIKNAELLRDKIQYMENECRTDFILYGALIKNNQKDLKEMADLGATCFKSFLSYSGEEFTSPNMFEVRKAMQEIVKFDGIASFHCEDLSITSGLDRELCENKSNDRRAFLDSRPVVAELIATQDIIALAEETGCHAHIVHVSHPAVAEVIRQAQERGVRVTAETCAHYLRFSEDDFLNVSSLFKCVPPLRKPEDREKLWEYVEKGVLACVGSDHSAGTKEQRDDRLHPVYELGNGISGIQTVLMSIYDLVRKRHASPSLIARCTSEAPAKIWGVWGRKGSIQPGFDADLVILDPERKWKIKAEDLYYKNNEVSCYIGLEGIGYPILTLLRGNVIARDGEYVGNAVRGEYITRLQTQVR